MGHLLMLGHELVRPTVNAITQQMEGGGIALTGPDHGTYPVRCSESSSFPPLLWVRKG